MVISFNARLTEFDNEYIILWLLAAALAVQSNLWKIHASLQCFVI